MNYYQSWSGGKDSTASIILEHINDMPKSTIIFSEVMFDRKINISGEFPEHIEWIYAKAIPLFNNWGYEVKVVRAKKDYLDLFYHKIGSRTKNPERVGKYAGWVLGGRCAANSQLKIKPMQDFYKNIKGEYIQYVGIAVDEPKRLEKLKNTNKVSLLQKFGYTERMAYDLCKQYNLLSPIYQHGKRGGGCWFCPNQSIRQFQHIKINHPNLWQKLEFLNSVNNKVSDNFCYGQTFNDINDRINNLPRKLF